MGVLRKKRAVAGSGNGPDTKIRCVSGSGRGLDAVIQFVSRSGRWPDAVILCSSGSGIWVDIGIRWVSGSGNGLDASIRWVSRAGKTPPNGPPTVERRGLHLPADGVKVLRPVGGEFRKKPALALSRALIPSAVAMRGHPSRWCWIIFYAEAGARRK